ncbi:mitochondrial cardiolipin hydrolase [Drosophila eugracilis]|uniref:mitochondrial cardiolipin hydrolase n=1 Tax=Drosophila eugracilis TaxID=29029 RepID=UPI0007E6ABB7|nr:mitochondrial cardiolipin hydrolase [Drosophila eugracilis]
MLNFRFIMEHIRNHPIVSTISIFVGMGLVSEVIWKTVEYFRDKREKASRVHEVLIFNELGEICASHHLRECYPKTLEFHCQNKYCTTKNTGKIVEQFDRAVYSIDLAIYTFTSMTISEALKRALHRGVNIRIISDGEMVYSCGSQIIVLSELGIPVRVPTTTHIMHNKYCVIDGAERVEEIRQAKKRKWMRPCHSIAITGSVNWTRQGFGGNWENCVITADEKISSMLQAEFDRMWRAFAKSETK